MADVIQEAIDKIKPLDRVTFKWGEWEMFMVRLNEMVEDTESPLRYRWAWRLLGKAGINDPIAEGQNLSELIWYPLFKKGIPLTESCCIERMALSIAELIEDRE